MSEPADPDNTPTPPNAAPRDTRPPDADSIDDFGALVAATLRNPESFRRELRGGARTRSRLLGLIALAMAAVGLLMATFSGGAQLAVVPIKVIGGTIAAMAVCFPSLFVFSNLAGSRVGFYEALEAMLVAGSVLSLVLVALAPVALVFSLSTASTAVVGWIHVGFLGVASWFAGAALQRVWADAASSAARVWMLLLVVVLLQLSTTLRPLVGEYEPLDLSNKKIFVEHWFGSESE